MSTVVDYKTIAVSFCMCVSSYTVCAGDYNEVFPTGTVWEEVYAEPGEPLDTSHTIRYEIGGDMLTCGKTYKQVLRNGREEPYYVREQEGCVWLLPEGFGREIKLYDFNWDTGGYIPTEYLLADDDSTVVRTEEPQRDCASATLDGGERVMYAMSAAGVVIHSIGRVTELNRNSCLLGYKVTSPVLPGHIYSKVIWIERGGKRIFQSFSSSEWTNGAPTGISPVQQHSETGRRAYLPSGIACPANPRTGIHIQHGRKRIIK